MPTPPARSAARGGGRAIVALAVAVVVLGLSLLGGCRLSQQSSPRSPSPSAATSNASPSTPPTGVTPGNAGEGIPSGTPDGGVSADGSGAPQPPPTRPAGCEEARDIPLASIPAQQRPLPGTADSLRALAALRVAARERGSDYCRAAFGPSSWPDLDANGCSARQDVLRRQATSVRLGVIASHHTGCREVLAGVWRDAYTGARLDGPNMKDGRIAGRIQIDHIVSLFDAWVSGARGWAPEKRVRFANDTSLHELYAVSATTNYAKSYRSAESWAPDATRQCVFARSIVEVKSAYGLSVTPDERAALEEMLHRCADKA
jgi:hypothetical protein